MIQGYFGMYMYRSRRVQVPMVISWTGLGVHGVTLRRYLLSPS